jgi:hypothetical protein
MKLANLMLTLILASSAIVSTALAGEGTQEVVVSVNTQVMTSSVALLQAMEVLSRGAYEEDSNFPGGVCQANSAILSVAARPSHNSPLQTPYLSVSVKWNCEAARDALLKRVSALPGLQVLPKSVLIGIHPGVIRAN